MGVMDPRLLDRNLRALAFQNPSLARRLCEPVRNDHVALSVSPSGDLMARFTRLNVPIQGLENPLKDASKAVEDFVAGDASTIFFLGVGLGYELALLLKKIPREGRVVAYERDVWLLRSALSLHDFAKDILTYRLWLLLGVDGISWWSQRTGKISLFAHPWLGRIYRADWERLKKDNFSKRRVLVAQGELFVEDVADALEHQGCRIWLWDPQRVSLEESRHQIKTFDPEFVFSINVMPGLSALCEELGVPYVAWEIDPTVERLKACPGKTHLIRIFTYRKAHVPLYRKAGFEKVEYLPLAANPRRRRPLTLSAADQERYGAPISFVGSSMKTQAQVLRHLFEKTCVLHGLNPKEARSLSRPVPGPDGRLVDLRLCMAEGEASEHRRRVVREILSLPYGCKVWGDAGWAEECPPSVYQGPAGHGEELTKIYNASWINLDIARAYQNDIVTMRVFDALACKAFVLAEYSSEILELLDEDREVIVYRNCEELKKLIRHFVKNHGERAAVAASGHDRVLKDHTMDRRMEWLLQSMN